MVWVLGYTPWTGQRPHAVYGGAHPLSVRKWLICLGRLGNIWGFTHQNNFASVSETWPASCTSQKACNHIWKTPNCILWRWYIVWTPPPFLFAKTPIWGLGTKNVQHLPDSPTPPEFSEGGRSPFLYVHSGGRNRYRIVGLNPFSLPILWHCTKHFGWVGWHLLPTSPEDGSKPLPPRVGGFT